MPPPSESADRDTKSRMAAGKVVLAGGSGFLGRALCRSLAADGYSCVVLGRSVHDLPHARTVVWDGRTLGPWLEELNGAVALINLVGRSVDCRPTARNRAAVRQSRLDSVAVLAAGCGKVDQPPPVWWQASAVGIYGDRGDEVLAEDADLATAYPAGVCQDWEQAATAAVLPQHRLVIGRIGVVLGIGGGAYPRLAALTRRGLGGTVGKGRQWLPWIHLADLVGALRFTLEREDSQGVYNLCAPEPQTNREFQRQLRQSLGVRIGLPAPTPVVYLGAWLIGTNPSLALASCRAVPQRLGVAGWSFRYPTLPGALQALATAAATR